jgi:hypothetical protein
VFDAIVQPLFDWGENLGPSPGADVIVVDFRGSGTVRAAIIGVHGAFSLGAVVPHLIAMAFNFMRTPDIETAVEAFGVSYTLACPVVFGLRRGETNTAVNLSSRGEMVATVVTDDRAADDRIEAASNYQAAKHLSRITRRPVVYVDVPDKIAMQSMRQLGMPASLIKGLLNVEGRRPIVHAPMIPRN